MSARLTPESEVVFFVVCFESIFFCLGGCPGNPKQNTIWSIFFWLRKEQECRTHISERSLSEFPNKQVLFRAYFFKISYSAGLQVFFFTARRTALTFPQPKGLAMWRTFELLGIADFMRKNKV